MSESYTAVPLRLDGSRNTRDLGGYPTADGHFTKYHAFLRSDELSALNEGDKEVLYRYGVRCVIDLRSDIEYSRYPSALEGYRDIAFFRTPLSDNVNDFHGAFPSSMGEMYVGLLDHSGEILARIFRIILQYPDSCVLFNCTAGKDRTGTAAMLLLKLAGVADADVIRDYAATEKYARPWAESLAELEKNLHITVPEHVFRSHPDNMRMALAHLEGIYGGAAAYLGRIGLQAGEIQQLRHKLVE